MKYFVILLTESGFFAEAYDNEHDANEFALNSKHNFVVIEGKVVNANGVLIFNNAVIK